MSVCTFLLVNYRYEVVLLRLATSSLFKTAFCPILRVQSILKSGTIVNLITS